MVIPIRLRVSVNHHPSLRVTVFLKVIIVEILLDGKPSPLRMTRWAFCSGSNLLPQPRGSARKTLLTKRISKSLSLCIVILSEEIHFRVEGSDLYLTHLSQKNINNYYPKYNHPNVTSLRLYPFDFNDSLLASSFPLRVTVFL